VRIISTMLWVTLILNTIHKSLAKYMSTTFKCKPFTISTPVSSEISDFTPSTHAQSNVLHTKYTDKTVH